MMTNQDVTNNIPIACNLTAIDAAHRDQHETSTHELFAQIQDVQELPNGYAFRLPAETLLDVATFIESERLCCPFFNFSLEAEPNLGPVWLRLTGSEEVKAFVKMAFGSQIDDSVVHKTPLINK